MWIAAFLMGQRMAGKAAGMGPVAQLGPSVLDRQIAELEQRTDRLMLLTEAMWELLASRGFGEAELVAKVEELQRRQQQESTRVQRCGGCGATILPGDERCQTCGAGTVER